MIYVIYHKCAVTHLWDFYTIYRKKYPMTPNYLYWSPGRSPEECRNDTSERLWDACKSYDVRVSWYYSPQISISSLTFGLRQAAGVLCSGDRSRLRRAASARPPAEAAPKPCYATPSRSIHLFACTPYRVLIIALNLFHSSIDRFRRPFVESWIFRAANANGRACIARPSDDIS